VPRRGQHFSVRLRVEPRPIKAAEIEMPALLAAYLVVLAWRTAIIAAR
jgi:hypothetical protein